MNRSLTHLTAAALALAMSSPAVAVEIEWYEQSAPGQVDGQVRLSGLAEGELEFDTPGRRLEIGIMRIDDVAVVILADPSGRAGKSSAPGNLVVVASQGSKSVHASFPLAMPAQANPAGPKKVAADVGSGRSTTTGLSLVTDSSVPADQLPETAAKPVRPPAPVILPTASNPLPDPAAGGADCRVLLLRPGSLRLNVQRLVRECGARMGRWNTAESAEWLVDWKVPADELLHRNNGNGLEGLLDLLEARYRLAGVADTASPGVIHFYRLRMDPYPSGRADANHSNTSKAQ